MMLMMHLVMMHLVMMHLVMTARAAWHWLRAVCFCEARGLRLLLLRLLVLECSACWCRVQEAGVRLSFMSHTQTLTTVDTTTWCC